MYSAVTSDDVSFATIQLLIDQSGLSFWRPTEPFAGFDDLPFFSVDPVVCPSRAEALQEFEAEGWITLLSVRVPKVQALCDGDPLHLDDVWDVAKSSQIRIFGIDCQVPPLDRIGLYALGREKAQAKESEIIVSLGKGWEDDFRCVFFWVPRHLRDAVRAMILQLINGKEAAC